MLIRFLPIKLETVVVVDENTLVHGKPKVIGTIKRYRSHGRCIVSVPGILSASANPGQANFGSIIEAKTAILDRAKKLFGDVSVAD